MVLRPETRPRSLTSVLALGLAVLASVSRAAEGAPSGRALGEAARRGDVVRLRSLLRQGAAVDVRDDSGFTALMLAASSPEAARLLLRAGADVDASTRSGWTALMQAAAAGSVETARVLVEAGAALDARDRLRGTALDVANQRGQPEVARLLRARGARGSGRSAGDPVCVRPWKGEGFCGVVDAVDDQRILIRVESLVGCADGCGGLEAECSNGKVIGGTDGVGAGATLWTKSWCLTHTGLDATRTP